MENKIFISYSSADRDFVSALVALLRAALGRIEYPDPVFQDSDTIRPGQNWRLEVEKAIKNAEKVFVFWCYHSKQSEEVEKEYVLALELGKVVIPALLDDTPLPDNLKDTHGIDLRPLNAHSPDVAWRRLSGHYKFSYFRNHSELLSESFAPIFRSDPTMLLQRLEVMTRR